MNMCRLLLLTLCLIFLNACSPPYDWREVPDADVGYIATFPDKPVKATRSMMIAGERVDLTLQSAKVGEGFFAVGVVRLTDEQQSKAADILSALRLAMQNNIAAVDSTPKTVVANGQTWDEVTVSGRMASGKPALMQARFAHIDHQLVEIVVMGEADQLSQEVREQWFSGFKWGFGQ